MEVVKGRKGNPKHKFYEVPDFRFFLKNAKFKANPEIFENHFFFSYG